MEPTVLVVERDDALRRAVHAHLTGAGLNVVDFARPMDAIAAIDGGSNVDLLLAVFDFGPGQAHGLSLARMAKMRKSRLPVILMTDHPENLEDEALPGMVVVKSIDPEALTRMVLSLLASAAG